MTKNEKKAVAKLVCHMQELQRQITEPSCEDATDNEVLLLFVLLWEWTPYPRYELPRKSVVEELVGLMRGCEPRRYGYISRESLARIIREEAKKRGICGPLSVYLCKDAYTMTDVELYEKGKWNYKPTPLVDLLWNMHCNPQMSNP